MIKNNVSKFIVICVFTTLSCFIIFLFSQNEIWIAEGRSWLWQTVAGLFIIITLANVIALVIVVNVVINAVIVIDTVFVFVIIIVIVIYAVVGIVIVQSSLP